MSVPAILFIKPVNTHAKTLNEIARKIPNIGYSARKTTSKLAKQYEVDHRKYPLHIPLKGQWSMIDADDLYNYKKALQERIPEIYSIVIKYVGPRIQSTNTKSELSESLDDFIT